MRARSARRSLVAMSEPAGSPDWARAYYNPDSQNTCKSRERSFEHTQHPEQAWNFLPVVFQILAAFSQSVAGQLIPRQREMETTT